MKRPTLIAAGSLNRLVQAAEEAWQRKDFQEAIETLKRASRLAPANPAILLRLGRFLGLRYDYVAAEACFEQALRFAPRKAETLTAIADHCHNFRNQEFARRYLQRALEQPDATATACLKLAELYERLRRLPEAAECLERALKLNPAYLLARLFQARLERQAGQVASAEQKLRAIISRPDADAWTRAMSWYELGGLLDRREQYDEAMTAFIAAKSLMRPQTAGMFDGNKSIQAKIKLVESNITAGWLQSWAANAPALPPPRRLALLCGYARSGTTLLEQVMDAHPDIVSAEETDVFIDEALAPLKRHVWPDPQILPFLAVADNPSLQQSRAAYFRAMDLCLGDPVAARLVLDKNPLLTFLIPAFVRIFPETKFLIALRDPRDVVLSRFVQPMPASPFSTAFLSLETTVADYVVYMNLWRKLAPLMAAPYLEVRYEDMVDDLESVARKTLAFLGVPWNDRVLDFNEHARKKLVRTPTYTDVTEKIYKRARGRWLNYQKYFEPHLAALEPFVKAFGYE